MEKINGIMFNDKFYTAIEKCDCSDCAFSEEPRLCARVCDICEAYDCAFRYSPKLTQRLNEE